MSIHAVLALESSSPRVIVQLTLTNMSKAENAYLDKHKVLATTPLRVKLFRVTLQSQEITYVGPMAKRKAPTPEDYFVLAPGQMFSQSFDITSSYEFRQGGHQYAVEYQAFHGDPYDDTKLTELKSNPVSFSFVK